MRAQQPESSLRVVPGRAAVVTSLLADLRPAALLIELIRELLPAFCAPTCSQQEGPPQDTLAALQQPYACNMRLSWPRCSRSIQGRFYGLGFYVTGGKGVTDRAHGCQQSGSYHLHLYEPYKSRGSGIARLARAAGQLLNLSPFCTT